MKIYDSLNVELTVQHRGNSWLGILRGPENEIELAYNGLFNFCADVRKRGSLDYCDAAKTIATFITSEADMFNYFCLRGEFHLNLDENQAIAYAETEMPKLGPSEAFVVAGKVIIPESYELGTKVAERPDTDAKDAILENAFNIQSDKNVKPVIEDETKSESDNGIVFKSVNEKKPEPDDSEDLHSEVTSMFDTLQSA